MAAPDHTAASVPKDNNEETLQQTSSTPDQSQAQIETPVEVSKQTSLRRSCGGKLSHLTRTITIVNSALIREENPRLIRSYRLKLQTIFEEVKTANEAVISESSTTEEVENAFSWLADVELQFETCICNVEDYLEKASIAPLKTPQTEVKFQMQPHPDPSVKVKVEEQKGPSHSPASKVSSAREEKCLSLDSWIDKLAIEDNSAEVSSSTDAQWADTLVSLTLKLKDFDGDAFQYQDFINSFRHQVHERTTLSPDTKMSHLLNHLQGPAKLAVEGLPHTVNGYFKALKLLKETFGNRVVISRAFINRVVNGPMISKEANELKKFYYQLYSCSSALEQLDYYADINSSQSLLAIAKRLPLPMQFRWKRRIVGIRADNKEPNLSELLKFVKCEMLAATDAVWGTLGTTENANGNTTKHSKVQNPSRKITINATGAKTFQNQLCFVCKESHNIWNCKTFEEKTIEERRKLIAEMVLCFNCLRKGHRASDCSSKFRCKSCKGLHHTLIHKEKPTVSASTAVAPPESPAENSSATVTTTISSEENVYLQVIPVTIHGPKGTRDTLALLDTGSQASLLDQALAQDIGLEGTQSCLDIKTVAGRETKTASKVSLDISSDHSQSKFKLEEVWSIKDLVLPKTALPSKGDIAKYEHLRGIPIPLPKDIPIGLLIGANAPDLIIPLECLKGNPSEPYAIKTALGWSLFGGKSAGNYQVAIQAANICESEAQSLEEFWTTESFGTLYKDPMPLSTEDRKAMTVLNEAKFVDDHYEIGLLWKDENVCLPNNKVIAQVRAEQLRKRFLKDPAFYQMYSKEVNKYLLNGHAEKLTTEQEKNCGSKTWYLPHQGVTNPNKPGRVRVVFDAASRYGGTSLNQQLATGPDLLNSLLCCLLRFRQKNIPLMADVEQMFHQTRVPEKDRDSLRFLWWSDGDLSKAPTTHRMTVHIFGATDSPCAASFALKKAASDQVNEFGEEIVRTVDRQFYMDDLLTSTDTEEEAIKLASTMRELFKNKGFRLTKWISTNKRVLDSIPESERGITEIDIDVQKTNVQRALGVKWDLTEDAFLFKVNENALTKPNTKRGVLSSISSMFSPDGMLAPILLKPKLLMQQMWKDQIDWDEQLTDELLQNWTNWKEQLREIEKLRLPRPFPIPHPDCHTSLHVFCDASEQGFGAVGYLRFQHENEINCSFVVGKSRCAPLKGLTIPRLELQAAVMGSRLVEMLCDELDMNFDEIYLWSDSKTTLAYLQNEEKRFSTFVANRVAEVKDLTSHCQWRFCPGTLNPADDASRGLNPSQLTQDCRWLRGPEFLHSDKHYWPESDVNSVDQSLLELKKEQVVMSSSCCDVALSVSLLARFSSWNRLCSVVATCLAFKRRCLARDRDNESTLPTLDELDKAESIIIRQLQHEAFPEEIKAAQSSLPCPKKSHLLPLRPFLDENGLLRVGGRLKHAQMDADAKHQLIIPHGHPIAKSILQDVHSKFAHGGKDIVLTQVRQRYWIVRARSMLRQLVHKCITCKKLAARPLHQLMSDLPKSRVVAGYPFETTGVDYFGPFETKVKRSKEKRWCCLFTCLTTRAVHLESTNSLSTDNFINVLRRFRSRRGNPRVIHSDNGTNFVGAEKELRDAINNWNQTMITKELQQTTTKWIFNPPSSPHMGGSWERLIRSIKRAMKTTMRGQTLHQETFDTVLAEIEALMNARPLTKISDDIDDPTPLTPNHFLLVRSCTSLPPGLFEPADMFLRKAWRRAQVIVNTFWRRWTREYLPTLTRRSKWSTDERNLEVGDLVLLREESLPRGQWPLGLVKRTFVGDDGRVRSVEIKTKNTIITRPTAKLCLLEAHE